MSQPLAADLREALSPVVEAAGLVLEDVEVKGVPPKRVVSVTVDLPDGPGGVSSDALAEVSRTVSARLDEVGDVLSGAYQLEVSTPGLTRPLTQPRHFRRAQGRLVTLQSAGETLRGRVIGADDDGVHLQPEPASRRDREPADAVAVPWHEVRSGTIEVEFKPAPTQGA